MWINFDIDFTKHLCYTQFVRNYKNKIVNIIITPNKREIDREKV